MSKQAYKRVRNSLGFDVNRTPLPKYCDVGCYPLFYLMSDGECMCSDCVNENIELIDTAIKEQSRDGWRVIAVDANWEDSDMICCNCDKPIESAYGDE